MENIEKRASHSPRLGRAEPSRILFKQVNPCFVYYNLLTKMPLQTENKIRVIKKIQSFGIICAKIQG